MIIIHSQKQWMLIIFCHVKPNSCDFKFVYHKIHEVSLETEVLIMLIFANGF
jgi:hypothetical protein